MTGYRLLHVAANELRSRVRDHTLAIVAIFAPVIFATVTSLAFANFDHPHQVNLTVTTGSAASAGNSLVRAIEDNPVVQQVAVVTVVPSVPQAWARIRAGSADAALALPPAAALGPGGAPVLGGTAQVLESQAQPLAAEVAEAVLQTIGGQQWLDDVVIRTLTGTVRPAALRGFAPRDPVTLADAPAGDRSLTAATYYSSSMAIVFLLFVATPMAKSLWTERRNNTLERIMATGLSRWTIVLGKAIAAQLIGMLSVALVWATSTVVFHAAWGDPGGVTALIAATVAGAVAISFGIASIVRTEASMDGLAATITFILVLAGGNFVPPPILPGAFRVVGLATPNGWALRGFLTLATSHGGAGAIAVPLLALCSFAAVVWLLIAARLKALVTP